MVPHRRLDVNHAAGRQTVAVTSRGGLVSVLLAALLFSTSGTAQALANVASTPLGVGAARLFVGTTLLIVLLPAFGQRRLDVLRVWRMRTALIAGACIGLFQWAFFGGVQGAGVALGTVLVIGSAPVFAGVLSWLVFKRPPSRAWALATGIGVIGLILLSSAGISTGSVSGVLLSLTAGLAIAVYTVGAKVMLDRGVHPILLLSSTCAFGAVLLLPIAALQPLGWLLEPRGIGLALYLGIATLAMANTLQLRGIRALGPAPVTTLMLAEPVLATILGVVVLGEVVGAVGWLGFILVLGSLTLESVTLLRGRAPRAVPVSVPGGAG